MNERIVAMRKLDLVSSTALPFLIGGYIFLDALPSLNQITFISLVILFICVESIFGLIIIISSFLGEKRDRFIVLLSFLVFLLMFFYQQSFSTANFINPLFGRHRYVIPFLIIVCSLLSAFLLMIKRNIAKLITCLCIIFLSLSVYSYCISQKNNAVAGEQRMKFIPPPDGSIASIGIPYVPDVFYIVLDSYTSSESLKEFWNYDNEHFLRDLETRGFIVSRKSKSFSSSTIYSMVSTFNMSNDRIYLNMKTNEALSRIQDSAVINKFLEYGFKIGNLSFFDVKTSKRYYEFLENNEPNDLLTGIQFFFRKSLFWAFVNQIKDEYVSDVSKTNLDLFAVLSNGTVQRSPQFTYAHIMMPHPPFGFDRNGNYISPFYRKSYSDTAAYLDQILSANRFILETIDGILLRYTADTKPIIIIQGDHGYRFLKEKTDNEKEHNSILNAYFLPHGGNGYIYSTISPYNTFRIIFDLYFDDAFLLLDDIK